MAGSLLVVLDDIAYALDDIAAMSKIAAKKTAGVLGDDLALNAEQVGNAGIKPERELPIVFAIAKGSMINKAILIPMAIGLSAFAPIVITPLLGLGGLYLVFEGSEKVIHSILHKNDKKEDSIAQNLNIDIQAYEKEKIKGAIKTDFILSAEIITIALGTFTTQPLLNQSLSLTAVGIGMTVGVYGTVAGIVKLDDIGLWMMKKKSATSQFFGEKLVNFMPKLMKGLTIGGTIAMFTVGGGILAHTFNHLGFNQIHHLTENLNSLSTMAIEGVLGLTIGTVAVGTLSLKNKLSSFFKSNKNDFTDIENNNPSTLEIINDLELHKSNVKSNDLNKNYSNQLNNKNDTALIDNLTPIINNDNKSLKKRKIN